MKYSVLFVKEKIVTLLKKFIAYNNMNVVTVPY